MPASPGARLSPFGRLAAHRRRGDDAPSCDGGRRNEQDETRRTTLWPATASGRTSREPDKDEHDDDEEDRLQGDLGRARDHNGVFTEQRLKVWNHGAFKGGYAPLHARIRAGMPASQSPNLFMLGEASAFLAQEPFAV